MTAANRFGVRSGERGSSADRWDVQDATVVVATTQSGASSRPAITTYYIIHWAYHYIYIHTSAPR